MHLLVAKEVVLGAAGAALLQEIDLASAEICPPLYAFDWWKYVSAGGGSSLAHPKLLVHFVPQAMVTSGPLEGASWLALQ